MFAILCADSCLLKISVGANVAVIQILMHRITTTVAKYHNTTISFISYCFMLTVEINAGGGLV